MWLSVRDVTSVTFRLRACNDAHVALSETKGITAIRAYEVKIGSSGNKISAIKDGPQGRSLVTKSTKDILSCSQSRWFWLSWPTVGTVYFGEGRYVGENVVMSVNNIIEAYNVKALGISTGWGATGTWQFSADTGTHLMSHCWGENCFYKCLSS